jgi:hypothetical protein
MVPPPADATVNKNGKRPPPSGQMYPPRAYWAALPSLDMEALFPWLENIDNTILPQSTPPAVTQSQLDDTTHKAASSMLSFASSATATDTAASATVTATVYADDVTFSPTRGGFDSDSEVDDASIAGPSRTIRCHTFQLAVGNLCTNKRTDQLRWLKIRSGRLGTDPPIQ